MTGAELEERILEGGPVLVQFWASWRISCLLLAPRLRHLAARLVTDLCVARVRMDHCAQAAQELGIRWLPALALFHHGRLVRCWCREDPDLAEVERFVHQQLARPRDTP